MINQQDKDPKANDDEAVANEAEAAQQAQSESSEDLVSTDQDADNADNDGNDEVADPAAELAVAQAEIIKLKDAFLRAKAEEDNVRRRSEKEVANSRKFAVEGFAKEMLQVRDSLKLACSVEIAEDADESITGVVEGVELTLKQLDAGFAKFSLTEIAPQVGDKLDPNLHQAMSIVEAEDVESGCIITVIQAGFQLHDRLLRPAMVVVAK